MTTGLRSSVDHVRNAILTVLLESSSHVSGEMLCQAAGVTRAAVWKHIRGLEAMGFQFDKLHGVGYQIIESPDLLLEPLLRPHLSPGSALGRNVDWKPVTASTNRDAVELAQAGAPHGTIVTAQKQEGGRGRNGKPWSSPVGGLWQSIVLRQSIPLHRAAELTLIASVAIRRALQKQTGLSIQIKWPNDLLCNGRKVCGILAEIQSEGEWVRHAVLGFGINTNIPAEAIPEALRHIATSTLAETGLKLSHLDFEALLLRELEPLLDTLREGEPGFSAVSEEWRLASATLGRHVRVATGNTVIEGEATRLDDQGVLYVNTGSDVVRILSGDVLF